MFGGGQGGRQIDNPIPGTALVIDGDSGYGNLTNWTGSYQLRVRVPGRDEVTVSHSGWINREKHPVPGFEFPVTVDAADPAQLRVEWDRVPTMQERIAQRDQAILAPEDTWRRVAPLRFVPAGADKDQIAQARQLVAGYLPESSVLLHDLDEAAKRGDPSTFQVSPWQKVQLPPIKAAAGRLPATALVVSASRDPYPQMRGDDFMPAGSHFASRGGSIKCSKYRYDGWLLLCVVPPSGARYGLYLRTEIHSRRVGAVLPITIDANDPGRIDIHWDAAPNLSDAAAVRADRAAEKMQARVAEAYTLQQSSVTAAIADVNDPAVRAQVQQMWARFGVDVPTGPTQPPGPPPPAAAPPPTAPPPTAPRDIAGELARLQALRDRGILTDAEFADQRMKLLESI